MMISQPVITPEQYLVQQIDSGVLIEEKPTGPLGGVFGGGEKPLVVGLSHFRINACVLPGLDDDPMVCRKFVDWKGTQTPLTPEELAFVEENGPLITDLFEANGIPIGTEPGDNRVEIRFHGGTNTDCTVVRSSTGGVVIHVDIPYPSAQQNDFRETIIRILDVATSVYTSRVSRLDLYDERGNLRVENQQTIYLRPSGQNGDVVPLVVGYNGINPVVYSEELSVDFVTQRERQRGVVVTYDIRQLQRLSTLLLSLKEKNLLGGLVLDSAIRLGQGLDDYYELREFYQLIRGINPNLSEQEFLTIFSEASDFVRFTESLAESTSQSQDPKSQSYVKQMLLEYLYNKAHPNYSDALRAHQIEVTSRNERVDWKGTTPVAILGQIRALSGKGWKAKAALVRRVQSLRQYGIGYDVKTGMITFDPDMLDRTSADPYSLQMFTDIVHSMGWDRTELFRYLIGIGISSDEANRIAFPPLPIVVDMV